MHKVAHSGKETQSLIFSYKINEILAFLQNPTKTGEPSYYPVTFITEKYVFYHRSLYLRCLNLVLDCHLLLP